MRHANLCVSVSDDRIKPLGRGRTHMINPHKPGDSLECCDDGCADKHDVCSCGACQCEVCADAGGHFQGCDQRYYY